MKSTLVLCLLAVSVTAAHGATAARDPVKLTLQKADYPAGARGVTSERMTASSLAALGVRGLRGATMTATVPAGGTVSTGLGAMPKEWLVSGNVYVAPGVAGARRLFALGRRAGIGLYADVSTDPRPVRLRRLGDEQLAFVNPEPPTGLHGAVFVRKGAVVWQLRIAPLPVRWHPSRATVLAALTTLAGKQRARVAS